METLPLISVQRKKDRFRDKLKARLSNLACCSFVLLLLWQITGAVLYFLRAYDCCLRERHTTFSCVNSTKIPHSEELELTWLLSQDISIALVAFFLRKVPGFLGFRAILKKAVRMPAFWSLVALHAMQIVGLTMIVYFNKVIHVKICLIAAFCLHGLTLIAILFVLNFTPLNRIRRWCDYFVFILFKFTLAVFFLQTFTIFVVGSVQFAFKVTGLDEVGRSANFVTIFRRLREFPQVIFYYRTTTFFWHKLFFDNRNILGHFQILRSRNDLLNGMG